MNGLPAGIQPPPEWCLDSLEDIAIKLSIKVETTRKPRLSSEEITRNVWLKLRLAREGTMRQEYAASRQTVCQA
ncbi:Uncharacterized protein ChrSV_2617 [Chromobacterium vaccinii]|nr:Uncharacterized protein ChrSW_2617 [Chromobacterium vaccinii]QND90074.1 Uncharacterized protein ChrSV_2617 [Chromobacterium vaccinii]